MNNPHRLFFCAHTFCYSCIDNKKCAKCKVEIGGRKNVQKDLIAQALIDEMEVKCLNKECPYKGTFDEYKNHHHKTCTINGLDDFMNSVKESLAFNRIKRKYSSEG